MIGLAKWAMGVVSVVVILLILALGGCGVLVEVSDVVDPSNPAATDGPEVREATPDDVAGVVVDVVAAGQPVIDGDDVTADDIEAMGAAAAPIMNPLTAGWWSAGVALTLAVWRQVEAGKRKNIIKDIDRNPNTPDAWTQVSRVYSEKVARMTGK